MLYVTTRVGNDAFTAFRALSENRGPEGGFFVPLHLPFLNAEQIASLAEKSFSQNFAEIMNLFFGAQFEGQDLELLIGRYPVKLCRLTGRVTVANAWFNPAYRFDRLVKGVENALRQADRTDGKLANWLTISARIAVLFGIYGLLFQNGRLKRNQKFDISVPSGDLSAFMAAWYARSMGLPVGTIICCCNDNDSLWNLFRRGELRTDMLTVRTCTPDCDYTVPDCLERLIFAVLGRSEAVRFSEICRCGGVYVLDADALTRLREGIHISVVSGKRVASMIPNLYLTTGLIVDPYTALAHCGLMDYRAVTGLSHESLIISEESPLFSSQFVSKCLNITTAELKSLLD